MASDSFQVERLRGTGNCLLLPVSSMRPPYRRNAMIGDRKPETKFAGRPNVDPDFTVARRKECGTRVFAESAMMDFMPVATFRSWGFAGMTQSEFAGSLRQAATSFLGFSVLNAKY